MRLFSAIFLAILTLLPISAMAQNIPFAFTERDCSISSLSGSSTTIAVANPNRKYLGIFNSGNTTVWVNSAGGTAAISGISSISVPSGGSLVWKMPDGVTRTAVTVIGTSGQPLACFEGN